MCTPVLFSWECVSKLLLNIFSHDMLFGLVLVPGSSFLSSLQASVSSGGAVPDWLQSKTYTRCRPCLCAVPQGRIVPGPMLWGGSWGWM